MSEEKKGTGKIRSPIVTVLGHIDHGKTSLLDYIRGTLVQKHEVGGITQHIGASFFPMEKVLDFCKAPPELRKKITVPGLLVIDTPGHTAFMNLRKRGGAVADIAVLVIEVPTGPMQTTWEAVRLLRDRKVPFIITANKIDRLDGWKPMKDADFKTTFKRQPEFTQQLLDKSVYEMVELFMQEGFPGCERFDRITDFTKNLAIVPTSAVTGEGIPSLLLVLVGLVQNYLQSKIKYTDGPAKGVVLEVKKEQGYGNTIDCIIFDGHIKKGQKLIVGGLDGPIETKVRALLSPKPLDEIRDPANRFDQNEIIYAAAGVKILAPEIDKVVAGAPLRAVMSDDEIPAAMAEIREELESINITTDDEGIILKADTLGSLEAAAGLFHMENIKIRKAAVGAITKQDVQDALAARQVDRYSGAVCGFNVKMLKDAENEADNFAIRVFTNPVIYRLVDEYKEYITTRKSEDTAKAMGELMMPGKITILPQYIFRRSDPLVVGVRVDGGVVKTKQKLITPDGKVVGTVHQMKLNNESVNEATKGQEVSMQIDGGTMGRNVKETDSLYVKVPESHIRQLRTTFREQLAPDVLETLIDYVKIMRSAENSLWGA
jgi:translation initiation factor 5B